MKLTALLAAAAAALVLAVPAFADMKPSQREQQHDRTVIRFFINHPKLANTPAGIRALFRVLAHQQKQLRSLQAVRAAQRAAVSTPRGYAQALAAERGWTGHYWDSLETIVGRESGWNPCARYPATSECTYTGGNACGVPQANPCPSEWRGRLAETWRAQVRWLIDYVARVYHDPDHALWVWNSRGSY